MRALQTIFDTVREAASRAAWSQGVELARSGAVFGETADASEVIVRVRPSGGMIHPTVILYPDDEEWECDCPDDEDPCAHVAAAVIAVRKARREGNALPPPAEETGGALHYRFTTEGTGLAFERVVVHGGSETPLRTTLTAATSGKVKAPPVSPGQLDIAVERALGTRLYGPMPRGVVRALVRALDGCEKLTLDGRAVRASREAVGMRAVLSDHGSGFRLHVEPDPPIDRELGDGFVLCGDVMREMAPTRLNGREAADLLGRGQQIPPDEIATVLSDVLPGLEERMTVSIQTDRLPKSERTPPRLMIETQRDTGTASSPASLTVLATLVYGDPPIARVDAGRLTHLSGAVPLRDEAAENALIARLRSEIGLTPGHRERFSGDAAIHVAGRLSSLGATISGDGHRDFRMSAPLEPEFEMQGDGFALRFAQRLTDEGDSDGEGQEADAATVFRAWHRGESMVPLAGGGYAPLPADWLERYGPLLQDLVAARTDEGQVPAALLPDLARLAATLDAPPPPGFARLATLIEGFDGLPDPVLPEDLEADLRSYQHEGIRWLQFLGTAGLGGLLADDMGLGKTLQALCAIRGRSLVVAPTSLMGSWQDEIQRFRPALKAAVYHGPGRALDPEANITLTTYAILRLDLERLREVTWNTLVLDEAQAIKNPTSQVAQAAYQLKAEQRITLTGTPVENRLDELWSQLHFLNPGLLGGRSDFDERYAKPIGAGDDERAAHLRERIRPFVLRRRKREVAPELPPRTELVLHCTLSEDERTIYNAIRAATQAEVLEQLQTGGGVMAALEALLRLRQACCHPRLLPGQDTDTSAKLDLLVDRLDTAASDGHRALVFSQWTSLLDLVEPRLQQAGLGFVRLDGSTRDRAAVVSEFQSEDGPPVFLVSLRAGGTGLNLTAADHVFLLDPWWNPAVEDQAADRAHRIGQDRPVVIHRMVAADTVEERILVLQERKRALADAALEGSGSATSITREELMDLLA